METKADLFTSKNEDSEDDCSVLMMIEKSRFVMKLTTVYAFASSYCFIFCIEVASWKLNDRPSLEKRSLLSS